MENDLKTKAEIINESFFSRYAVVIGTARRYAPDAELAKDIVQQAYVDFVEGARKKEWDLSTDVGPLLATITKNAALRLWKERKKDVSENRQKFAEFLRLICDEYLVDYEDKPWEDELTAMKQCLERLPPKSREIIDMRYFLNASIDEIAQLSGASQRTVQQMIRRIREKLKLCIEYSMKQREINITK